MSQRPKRPSGIKGPSGFGRRAFLGGAAATIALPFLESLAPRIAHAASDEAARRLLFFYVPNGFHMPSLVPGSEGTGFDLPPILQPLAALSGQFSVLSGLDNFAATAQGDGPGDHARGTASFLTATHIHKTAANDIRNGISVDQAAAAHLAGSTALRSLELGTDGGSNSGGCDSGYACTYTRNISWSGPTTPVTKEIEPQLVFDRLFAGFDTGATAEEILRRRARRTSVLDYVREEANSLAGRLDARDRSKIDEYLTGVRELEQRIALESVEVSGTCEPGQRPDATQSWRQRVEQMIDLMIAAFRCDRTRVISFMMGNASSGRSHNHLGISEGHHDLSHHQNDSAKQAKIEQINIWEVQQLARLLDGMRAVEEADGKTLLDNSLVFFSSECADGNSHAHLGLPVILAGGAGGAVIPGRHIAYGSGTPMADLFISILGTIGLDVDTFGDDGSQPLLGLT